MSHGTQDEYYDYPYDFDDPFDDYNDPDDSHECPDDTDEDSVECDDDDYGREDSCNDDYPYRCKASYHKDDRNDWDQEFLYRCAARYKGGIICKAIFETVEDIYTHLNHEHHTSKWLVHEFIRSQN